MKALYRCTSVSLWFAMVTFTAMPAWADGELDTSFGTDGVVRIAFPDSSVGYLRDVAVVNGAIEAAGFEYDNSTEPTGCATPFPNLFVVRLSLAGTLIGTPSSHVQTAIQCPTSVILDSATGDIYVIGAFFGQSTAVARFDATGTAIATYQVAEGGYGPFCNATRVLLDNEGRFVAACGYKGEFGLLQNTFLRLSDQLTGDWPGTLPGGMARTVITQDASTGAYYMSGAKCKSIVDCTGTSAINVVRLNADSGSPDTSYGSGGVITVFSADGQVNGITLDGSGNALIGGAYADASSGFVARLDTTGTPDATFGTNGVVQNIGDSVADVRTDHSNRVYALGSASALFRFKSSGARDTGFSASSNVQTLNGPGSRWQSIQFADSSHSSAYLVGGAVGCVIGCNNPATTAVIAKVMLGGTAGGPGPTTTKLSSSATTITSGQSVTFTATVTGTNPTGTVTLRDGSAVLGDPVNLNSGSASLSTVGLTVGSHTIAATYSGDVNNDASTSATVTETVNAMPSGGGPAGSREMSAGGSGGGSFTWIDLCGALLAALWRSARTSNFSARRGLTWIPGRSQGVLHA